MDRSDAARSAQARLEEWIRLHGDKVLRACYLWLKDVQLAEDAMQETFLKAWKALPEYEQRAQMSDLAFLLRIAVNTCRDMRRGFWFTRVNRAVALEDLPPGQLSVCDEDRSLFLSVTQLPLRHRQILILYYYIGLNLRECAQTLGIQLSSAHHRLKRAEACLKTTLEGENTNEAQVPSSH
ncbi:MAG TPA: sigma-70 family RNA polymerase sigma factor [Clostridia bacterium]|nr:sigma-70 family RNA polymerase sigma factor [Clostridia bacterium]